MTVLRDFSVLYAIIFRMIMLFYLFESRFPKKKCLKIYMGTQIPLTLINLLIFTQVGPQIYMTLLILTLTLPSLIMLGFLAKHRDCRSLFTLLMVDTVVIEIIDITNILEFYISGDIYLFTFLSRLIIYPLLAWAVYKYIRPEYLQIQKAVTKGWNIFSVTALLFYVLISISMSYPTMVTERPEYILNLILLFILMPIVYISIFIMLKNQRIMHEISEQENILRVQSESMDHRINEFVSDTQSLRCQKHNLHHQMHTIMGLIENKNYDELRMLVLEYIDETDSAKSKKYCSNPILDAMLSSYITRAEQSGISVKTDLRLPDTLPVSEAELSTVFANAIKNAIYACEKLPKEERIIEIKSITSPTFMFMISNSYSGEVEFDKNKIPVSHENGHGLGTRSIVAFCEKHGAFYDFTANGNTFSVKIIFE